MMSEMDDTRAGYIHEAAFLEGVDQGKSSAAETIAELRAEVERLKVSLEREQNAHAGTTGSHARLREELDELREDRRVLAEEVKAWREASRLHAEPDSPLSKRGVTYTQRMNTNASGVLGRVT